MEELLNSSTDELPRYVFSQLIEDTGQRQQLHETLEDLKQLHEIKNAEVYDALNDQTGAMIDIAENVSSLYDKFCLMLMSASQLRETCQSLCESCTDAMVEYSQCRSDYLKQQEFHKYKVLEACFNQIISNVQILFINYDKNNEDDIEILERYVNEYSCYLLQAKYSGDNIATPELDSVILRKLNCTFINAYETNNSHVCRCLVMYDLLNKHKVCESLFQNEIIKPHLEKIFNQDRLQKEKGDISVLYSEAMDFISTSIDPLTKLLEKHQIDEFDFVLNCFWEEARKLLCENLPLLHSAGNPVQFQKRYNQTYNFLKLLATKCSTKDAFLKESFQDYLKKFDTLVYYEICHQNTCSNFEKDLLKFAGICETTYTTDNDDKMKLQVSLSLEKILDNCFNDDVLLEPVIEQFIKLFMLLFSRYFTWISQVIKEYSGKRRDDLEYFLVSLITDLRIFKYRYSSDNQHSTMFKSVSTKMDVNIFKRMLVVHSELIDASIDKVKSELIDNIFNKSEAYLNEVTSIPRLYRRTNKSIPKKNSVYVVQTLLRLLEFNQLYTSVLNQEDMPSICTQISIRLAEKYLKLVLEVINSVCKTEQSLRRLKNRQSTQQEATDSDEFKIREQIKLDVEYFISKVNPVVSPQNNDLFDKLKSTWNINKF